MKIATFIDCENIHFNYAEQIFEELRNSGDLLLCNGYGDFANIMHQGWRDSLMRNGVRAIQVFHNTKDGADSEILIDATECAIKEKRIDAVCIVSNDGIYHSLKRALHRYGKQFHVIGTRFASQVLIDSSDDFHQLEKRDIPEWTPTVAINDIIERNGGRVRLAEIGIFASGLIPDFKALGFRNMLEYVESLGFTIEADERFTPPVHWVLAAPK